MKIELKENTFADEKNLYHHALTEIRKTFLGTQSDKTIRSNLFVGLLQLIPENELKIPVRNSVIRSAKRHLQLESADAVNYLPEN